MGSGKTTKEITPEQLKSERLFIQETLNGILLPFVELIRRDFNFVKGVLTAIRPHHAPVPEFEPSMFSLFQVAARFFDPRHEEELSAPEILSLIHAIDGFALNTLFVSHRHATFYRYGLVLEAEQTLDHATIEQACRNTLKKEHKLDRIVVEREPALQGHAAETQMGLIFEAYRTLTTEKYVKFYFRNHFTTPQPQN